MGLIDSLKAIVGAGSPAVRLDGPAAEGAAEVAVTALIADVKLALAPQMREGSSAVNAVAVIKADQLEACTALLTRAFGDPKKPFGQSPAFDGPLEAMVDSQGGIDKGQCLHLRRYADGLVAFAALWPWSNGVEVTLKIGVYAPDVTPPPAQPAPAPTEPPPEPPDANA